MLETKEFTAATAKLWGVRGAIVDHVVVIAELTHRMLRIKVVVELSNIFII